VTAVETPRAASTRNTYAHATSIQVATGGSSAQDTLQGAESGEEVLQTAQQPSVTRGFSPSIARHIAPRLPTAASAPQTGTHATSATAAAALSEPDADSPDAESPNARIAAALSAPDAWTALAALGFSVFHGGVCHSVLDASGQRWQRRDM
jgi:hypothetical protein